MRLSLTGFIFCAIISATPTNPQLNKTLTSGTPRYNSKLTTRGYSLSKVTLYKQPYDVWALEWALNGIKMEFSPDSGVGDPITILYGLDTVNQNWKAYETLITKRITSVDIHCDSTDMFGFRFGHPDGTKTATPNVIEPIGTNACYPYTIQGNFIGIDVIFKIVSQTQYVDKTKIAFWDDIGGNPCIVPTTVSFLQTDDVVYFLRHSQITSIYGLTVNKLCFTTSITISYQKGEETVVNTAFSFMTVDETAKSVKILTSDANNVGLYKVLLSATVSDSTFSLNGSSQFQIQIKHDCENTVINGATIADITAEIKALQSDPATTTRALSFTNSVDSTSSGYCGTYTYTLSPVLSFVQIVNSNSLEVTLTDLASIGAHNLTLTVAMASYSSIPTIQKAFKVILECKVKNIEFTTQPSANNNFMLGVDASPLALQFVVTITPNCPTSASSSLAFSLITATTITTEIIKTQTSASLNLTPSKNNVGTVQLKVRAAQDSSQADSDFQLTVINPCAQASILPYPDTVVSDFSVVLPLASRTKSQAFTIKIGMPQIYTSVVCSFTTELDLGATNISIASDRSQITFTYTENADLGALLSDQQRNLTVKIVDYPSITATFAFRVLISVCQITYFQTSTTSTTLYHNLDSMNPLNIPFSTSFSPVDCVISTISYTVIDKISRTAIANMNADNVGVSINTSDYQLIGNREYEYTATMAATSFMTQKQTTFTFSVNFYPGACATATVSVPQISFQKIKYTIKDQPKLETFPPFSDNVQTAKGILGVCGQRAYSIAEGHSFVKILAPPQGQELTNNWSLEVFSSSQTQGGVYEAKLTATLVDYPNSTPAVYSFLIEIIDPCISTKIEPQAIKNMLYKVGNAAQIQNFSQFPDTVSRALADAKLCGDREYSLIGAPSFVQLTVPINQWDSDSLIQVQTFDATKAGSYSVTLSAKLSNYKSIAAVLATFIIQIQAPDKNKKPYFASKIESLLTIQMSSKPESWSYTFPDIKDDDNSGELSMSVDLGSASSFVIRNKKVIEVTDTSDASKVRPGSYFFKVTVSDSIDEVVFQGILLVFGPIVEKTKSASCSVKFVAPDNQQVTYQSGSTPLTVSWPRFQVETDCEKREVSLSVKSDWSDDRFTQDSDWFSFSKTSLDSTKETSFFIIATNEIFGSPFQATVYVEATLGEITAQMNVEVTILARSVQKKAVRSSADQRFVVPPQMKINKFDMIGQLTLSFSEKVIAYNLQSDEFKIEPQKFLRLTVIKNPLNRYADNPKYIQSGAVLSMRVLSFSEREIKLQIELSNPLYVSFDPLYRDLLALEVIDPTYFVSALDSKTTILKGTRLQLTIDQPLAPADAVETLKSVNSGVEKANILATSSLPVNIVLGASLKFLWGMVNSLQFVVYMKDWKVNWPPNAKLVVQTLETIALGKFIEKEKIKRKLMDFYGFRVQYDNAKQARELQELKTNLKKGRIAFTVVGLAVFLISGVAALCFTLRSKYRQKIIQMAKLLKKKLFWNFFIRTYLTSFLSQSLWIVRFLVVEQTAQVSINRKAFMYTVTFIFLVLIPALLTFLIHRNFKRLHESESNQQFGSLYVGVRTTSRWSAFQVLMFLITRLSFAIISFKLRQWPGVLVLTFMMLNLTNIIYVGWVFPYESFSQQGTEIFNACMLQLIAYIMLFLTNLMSGPESEFTLGWGLVGVIGIMFAGNLLVMLGLNISVLCRRAYLYYLRFKRRKESKAGGQQVQAVFQQKIPQEDDLQIISEQDEEDNLSKRAGGVLIKIEEVSQQNTVRDFHNITQLLTPLQSNNQKTMLAKDIISRYAQQAASQILEDKQAKNENSDIFVNYEQPINQFGHETPSPLLKDFRRLRLNSVNTTMSGPYRDARFFSNDSLEIKPLPSIIPHEEPRISEESIREIQEKHIPAKTQDQNQFLQGFPILQRMMKNYRQQ